MARCTVAMLTLHRRAFLLSECTFLSVPHPRYQGAARPLPILGRGIPENVVDKPGEHWLTKNAMVDCIIRKTWANWRWRAEVVVCGTVL